MNKPIVFLSHSVKDKVALNVLKEILDRRAAGALEFFLSSDGQSIKFGQNWNVRISDALGQAQLMFVFLSKESANSRWIHFEAGCAYNKNIQVVPVCLPGLDIDNISPPLSLLQGFNLHSDDAMGNLARICNEKFKMKIDENFNTDEFNKFNCEVTGSAVRFFTEYESLIDSISLEMANKDLPHDDFAPIAELNKICTERAIQSHFKNKVFSYDDIDSIALRRRTDVTQRTESFEIPGFIANSTVSLSNAKNKMEYSIDATLSPDLFHFNAPIFDSWMERIKLDNIFGVSINWHKHIVGTNKRHFITSRLSQKGISAVDLDYNSGFKFDGLTFLFSANENKAILQYKLSDKLADARLSSIVEILFKSGVLWEKTPQLVEVYDS